MCLFQSPNSSHPIPSLMSVYLFSMCLYFCFANKIFYTISLDSTYMCCCAIFVLLFLTFCSEPRAPRSSFLQSRGRSRCFSTLGGNTGYNAGATNCSSPTSHCPQVRPET